MAINKTYTSNTLYNDSTGVIAFAEQLKQELINWANYHHVTEELGPDNRPDTQNALNNLFLSVYERFLTFLNDADATEEAINTWKEIENFLADYTDEKTLAEIVAELNANIESRLTVPLESTTGSSTTSTMTQKAITEAIDASKTFTTGEKVDNVGIDSEPTAGSDNMVKSGGITKAICDFLPSVKETIISATTIPNLELKVSGLYGTNNNFKVDKYRVVAGDTLALNLSKDGSAVCQWQSDSSIPTSGTNTKLIGKTITTTTKGVVKVPAGATFLMVCSSSSNTSNSVYKVYNSVDNVPTKNSKNLVQSGGVLEVCPTITDVNNITGNSVINLSSGYIKTSGDTADINAVVSHQTFHHAVVPCTEGTTFTINAIGGGDPRAWAFVDSSGNIINKSNSSATVTNLFIAAPASAAYLIINDNGGNSVSYTGILNRYLALNNNLGVFDTDFVVKSGNTTGTLTFSLGKIYQKGGYVKITNKTSQTHYVTFLDNKQEIIQTQYTGSSASSAAVNVIQLVKDAYFVSFYTSGTYNIQFEYGLDVKRYKSFNKTKGYFKKTNNTYNLVDSNRYLIYQYFLEQGDHKIITRLPNTTESNFVPYVVLKDIGDLSSNVLFDGGVQTYSAEGYQEYTISIPTGGAYLLIAQGYYWGSEPFISSVKQKYDFPAFKEMVSHSNLLITDGKIVRGNAGTMDFTLYNYSNTSYIVKAKTGYTGNAPYLTINGDKTYKSIRMDLYANSINGFTEIRIPPHEVGKNTYYSIELALPQDSYVEYLDIIEEHTLQRRSTYDGIDVNAHLGFTALAPENTMPGFIAAYHSGYDAIICNPKRTADGVWVCCHDATINRTARNADGTTISSTITIGETNYEDLLDYDFGIAYNSAFAGTKIPKLEEFLKLCAITGIRPIFSMHSNDYLSELATLLKKYGQLHKLVLKISFNTLDDYYNVFGDIYMYDFVINNPQTDLPSIIQNAPQHQLFNKVRMMVDVPYVNITEQVAQDVVAAGLLAGVYDLQATLFSWYKTFVGWGVTQFTDDRYPVTGLRWID